MTNEVTPAVASVEAAAQLQRQQDARSGGSVVPTAKRARLSLLSGVASSASGAQQSGAFMTCVDSLPSGLGRGMDDMDDADMNAFFGSDSPLGFSLLSPAHTPSPPLSPSIGRSSGLPEKRVPLVTDSWHGMLSLSGLL